jgi:hypothetical protein
MLKRRRTKRERERQLIEEAEITRRLRAGEPLAALANPNVIQPDPEAVKAVREHDDALHELARTSALPDPAPDRERLACWKHPEWNPTRPFPGAPLPPPSECPMCLEEADARERELRGQVVYLDGGVPEKQPTSREALAWERHKQELRERGLVLAGSEEERQAVARADEVRQRELEARSGGRVVYSNPFSGVVIRRPLRAKRGGRHHVYDRLGNITVRA